MREPSSGRVVERFQEHSRDYPWKWQPIHVDEYFADRRSAESPASVSTLRAQAGAIRAFCGYLTEPLYGWAPLCEQVFNDVPSQIVSPKTISTHATASGADYARYVGAIVDNREITGRS